MARLVRWCEIGSGSDDPDGLTRMRDALVADLAHLADAVEELGALPPWPGCVRALRRPEAPLQVLLIGHYDTVYGPTDPRRTQLSDPDTLRGPGSADMKGGLVIALEALRLLEQAPAAERVGWELLVTPDEEIGSPRSAPFIHLAAARNHLGLVLEPALPGGRPVRARKGIGTLRIVANGRAAHSGRNPEEGRNAIVALAEVLLAAEALGDPAGAVGLSVGAIEGGGAVNVVPERAAAAVDLRASDAGAAERAVAELVRRAAEIGGRREVEIVVEGGLDRPPKVVDPATEALFALYRRCAAQLGVDLDWADSGGSSDGSLLAAAGLPCLDGVGAVGGGLHSPEEYVVLSSLAERATIAARFMAALAAEGVPAPAG